MVSTWHVGGTRGSGIVSTAADVLWMRGLVECVTCVCLGAACVERRIVCVMWSELLMTSSISGHLCTSAREWSVRSHLQ